MVNPNLDIHAVNVENECESESIVEDVNAADSAAEGVSANESVDKSQKKTAKSAKKINKANKKRRLRSKAFRSLVKGVVLGAVLGAIVNVIVAFVTKAVYTLAPSGSIEMTGDLLSFNNRFAVDVASVIDYAISGAVMGIAVCVVLALILSICRAVADRRRFRRVEGIRTALNEARPIVCESYIKIKAVPKNIVAVKKTKKRGTLFLTGSSIEFYGKKFNNPKKNFLIKLSDVSFVQKKSNRKLVLFTADGKYIIRVPKGTAKRWKKAIVRTVKAK